MFPFPFTFVAPTASGLADIDNVYSMEFDRATATYMQTGINIASGSNFSVSFWVKGNISVTAYPGIFPFAIGSASNSTLGRIHPHFGAKFMIQSFDNNNANFGNRVIDINIYDGNWYHIVFTRDNSSGQIFAYVNGANVEWSSAFGSIAAPSITLNPSGDLYFGTAAANASYAWDGWLDEFALFDYTLDANQVEEIYNATSTGKTADLSSMATPPVAWYRMGD